MFSEQYKGNYMFPLLVEEGGKKSGQHVPQELLNQNIYVGTAVVATHQGIATGVTVQATYGSIGAAKCISEAAHVSSGHCCSYPLCPW